MSVEPEEYRFPAFEEIVLQYEWFAVGSWKVGKGRTYHITPPIGHDGSGPQDGLYGLRREDIPLVIEGLTRLLEETKDDTETE